MKLGRVIKVLLKSKGITQAELARKVNKSPTAISQILNGLYRPNAETLEAIAKVLEIPVPIIYFLSLSEDDIPEEKKELYKMLSPSFDKFLFEIFSVGNK